MHGSDPDGEPDRAVRPHARPSGREDNGPQPVPEPTGGVGQQPRGSRAEESDASGRQDAGSGAPVAAMRPGPQPQASGDRDPDMHDAAAMGAGPSGADDGGDEDDGSGRDDLDDNVPAGESHSERQNKRKVRGAQTRQRERQMVQKLEAELEHLTEMVSLNRSNYLCIQSTGLLPLLRSNPDLAKNKLQVQESFTAVLRMLWNCLQQTNTQHDGVSALVQEAVQLFRRLSQLSCTAGWHGTALIIMEDGFLMHEPGVPTLMGDIPMASWLRTYLANYNNSLHPTALQELSQLVTPWSEVEATITSELKLWHTAVRNQSITQVQRDLAERLCPSGSIQGGFVLRPGPASDQQGGAGSSVPSAMPDDAVSEIMTAGCKLVQHNEEFRCLALTTLQNQLGPWDLARFLVCRISIQDSVRDLSTLDHQGQLNNRPDRMRR